MGKIKALILDHPDPPAWTRPYIDYEDLWEIQQCEPSFPVDPVPVPLPATLFTFDEDLPF